MKWFVFHCLFVWAWAQTICIAIFHEFMCFRLQWTAVGVAVSCMNTHHMCSLCVFFLDSSHIRLVLVCKTNFHQGFNSICKITLNKRHPVQLKNTCFAFVLKRISRRTEKSNIDSRSLLIAFSCLFVCWYNTIRAHYWVSEVWFMLGALCLLNTNSICVSKFSQLHGHFGFKQSKGFRDTFV